MQWSLHQKRRRRRRPVSKTLRPARTRCLPRSWTRWSALCGRRALRLSPAERLRTPLSRLRNARWSQRWCRCLGACACLWCSTTRQSSRCAVRARPSTLRVVLCCDSRPAAPGADAPAPAAVSGGEEVEQARQPGRRVRQAGRGRHAAVCALFRGVVPGVRARAGSCAPPARADQRDIHSTCADAASHAPSCWLPRWRLRQRAV